MITLYHYTDYCGYAGIQRDLKIWKATRHAFHGSGVYFNTRKVDHVTVTKADVANDNYMGGGSANLRRGYVSYAVAVDFPESDVRFARSNVWMYPTDDHLDLTKYTHRFFAV